MRERINHKGIYVRQTGTLKKIELQVSLTGLIGKILDDLVIQKHKDILQTPLRRRNKQTRFAYDVCWHP